MVVGEADLPKRDSIDQPLLLDDLPGPAKSPDLEAILSEGFDRMLETLDEDSLREIALGKLAGLTDRELAKQLKCSRRTITNKLKLIRLTWEDQP
jgi:DNA-directed RNA polymerase specialized sigma24 family protein